MNAIDATKKSIDCIKNDWLDEEENMSSSNLFICSFSEILTESIISEGKLKLMQFKSTIQLIKLCF